MLQTSLSKEFSIIIFLHHHELIVRWTIKHIRTRIGQCKVLSHRRFDTCKKSGPLIESEMISKYSVGRYEVYQSVKDCEVVIPTGWNRIKWVTLINVTTSPWWNTLPRTRTLHLKIAVLQGIKCKYILSLRVRKITCTYRTERFWNCWKSNIVYIYYKTICGIIVIQSVWFLSSC